MILYLLIALLDSNNALLAVEKYTVRSVLLVNFIISFSEKRPAQMQTMSWSLRYAIAKYVLPEL